MLTYLKVAAALTAMSCLACTRDNPAFRESRGDAESSGDTQADATMTTSTIDTMESGVSSEVSSSTDDTQTAPSTSSDTSGTETGPEMCVLPDSPSLAFKIYSEAGLEPCGELFDAYFMVNGPSFNNQIEVQPCNLGCEFCEDGPPLEVEAWPADLSDVALPLMGSCIHVQFDGFMNQGNAYCQYEQAVVSYVSQMGEDMPVLVGRSGGEAVPTLAAEFVASLGLTWELVPDEVCDCPPMDDCCLPEDPPTIYGFMVGETLLRPGDVYDHHAPDQSIWEFEPWEADYLDSCGANLQVGWLLHMAF